MMRALVGWLLGAIDEAACAALAMAVAGLALSLAGPRARATREGRGAPVDPIAGGRTL